MKIVLRIISLFFILTITLNAQIEFTKEEQEYIKNNRVKIAMLPDFPPFSMYENGEIKGLSYDILQYISEKSSLKFDYEINKWPVNLKKFKEKKIDMIDSISFRENRLSFTNYTKPYYEIPLMIFSRKEFSNYKDLLSLKGKKLGVTKNIFYRKQIEELGLFKIVEFESSEKKLTALAHGDVDIVFGHLQSTQDFMKKKSYTNVKVLDELNLPNLKKTDLRFGVTKENEILFNIITKSFNSISEVQWNQFRKKWIDINISNKKTSNIIDKLSEEEKIFLAVNKFDCVVASWPPFINIKDKIDGISIDIWKIIKKKALINSRCEVVSTPDEAYKKIKNKKAHITLTSTISADKMSYGRFSIPYLSYPIAISTTMEKRYISDLTTLENKKIGLTIGHGLKTILNNKYPNSKFIEYENNIDALKALAHNEIFAYVDILPVLSNSIKEYGYENIKVSGITDFNYSVRIMVREDYQRLVSIINKAINSIPKYEIDNIKNKWISVKYENIVDYTLLWQIVIIMLIILVIIAYRQVVLNTHNNRLKEANNEIKLKTKLLEQKSIELKKQKELFEKMFNESSDGILLALVENKKLINCNEVACNLLGFKTKEEFLSQDAQNTVPKFQPDGRVSFEIIEQMIEKALKKGSCQFELLHKRKDDSSIWLEVVITPITINKKNLLHVVWRDIRKRKDIENELSELTARLEERVKKEVSKNEEKTKQLIQQSRLAQMGEMISMIAHQWRQPLTAISATTNNLLIRLMIGEQISKEKLEEELNLMNDYSIHLSTTIDDFRNFFKIDKKKELISLEEIIDNSLNIIGKSLESKKIILRKTFECNKKLEINSTEINQVILNIIKNSEDALVDNLVLNSEIRIKTYIEDSLAKIEISDNAGGIKEDILEKIFDPYFSTKSEKEGTGLGLYMSKIIIEDHCKGKLIVTNSKAGAIFTISLPL